MASTGSLVSPQWIQDRYLSLYYQTEFSLTSLLFCSRPWVNVEQTVFAKFTTVHFILLHTNVLCHEGISLQGKTKRIQALWGTAHLSFVKYFIKCFKEFTTLFTTIYHPVQCGQLELAVSLQVCESVCPWARFGITEGNFSPTRANNSNRFNELSNCFARECSAGISHHTPRIQTMTQTFDITAKDAFIVSKCHTCN